MRRITICALFVASFGFVASGNHAFAITWTTLDAPGASATAAYGISGGSICGTYQNPSSIAGHGFRFDGAAWTTLDVPLANGTWAHGIDGSNIVSPRPV